MENLGSATEFTVKCNNKIKMYKVNTNLYRSTVEKGEMIKYR